MPSHNDGKPWVSIYTYTDRVAGHPFNWSHINRQSLQTSHEPIGALTLNANGSLLASGSVKGTNVKIYSTADCTLLRKLSRGTTHSFIKHLCFSRTSGMISLTSDDKSTIHVWRCSLETYSGASAD